jgi:hypothetical protein
MSTKRTTANKAYDTNGRPIKLLTTRITADHGYNRLTYEEIRRAVAERDTQVVTIAGCGERLLVPRQFGGISLTYIRPDKKFESGGYFAIGCHAFDLKNFNRILRAAGVRTTKKTTAKRFAAAA